MVRVAVCLWGLIPGVVHYKGGVWGSEDIPTYAGGYGIPYLSGNYVSGTFGRWGSSWRTVSVDYILAGGSSGPTIVVFTGFTP